MKRIKVIGLALFAVAALSAVVVSAASAYTQPKFSLENFIKTSDSGSSTLASGTSGANSITCTSLASKSGENATIKSTLYSVSGIQIEYKGCSGKIGSTTCTGLSTITTELLNGELGETSATTVGFYLTPASGSTFAKFKCNTSSEVAEGSIIGEVSPLNVLQATGTVTFTANSAETSQTTTKITTATGEHTAQLKAFGKDASLSSTDTESFETTAAGGTASTNEVSG